MTSMFLLVLLLWGSLAHAATLPTLPTAIPAATLAMPAVTGNTYNATCATLQAQLNAAAAANVNLTHQVILGPNGVVCTQTPITLPAHSGGTGWILVKGTNYALLPPTGTRIGPSDLAAMPTLQYNAGSYNATISALTNAQRYRLIGLRFIDNPAVTINSVYLYLGLNSGGGLNTGFFILDRLAFQDTQSNTQHHTVRAIQGNNEVGTVALLDSYCTGLAQPGNESQCLQADNGPGPWLIQNNYLEGSGQGMMFCGGADPLDDAHMPRDGTIRLNDFFWPSSWFVSTGAPYTLKAQFELKCGVRMLIEGNTFSNASYDGGGFIFRLTPRNIFGDGTFSDMSDITIRHNLVKNVSNWIQILPNDDQAKGPSPTFTTHPSKHVKRVLIENNLVYGLANLCGGGSPCGAFIRITIGGTGGAAGNECTDPSPNCKVEDLTVRHNTVDDIGLQGQLCAMQDGVGTRLNTALDWSDNIMNNNNNWGIFDCNNVIPANFGSPTLSTAWGGIYTYNFNTVAGIGNGDSSAHYPALSNLYPSSVTSVLFTNRAIRDYTLQATSPSKNTASDGTDRGVNFTTYNAARVGGTLPVDSTPPAIPAGLAVVAP